MLLLDTQLVLWVAFDPDRLPPRTRRRLESRDEAASFSVATLWEVAIKSSLARPGFEVDARALRAGLLASGFDELPIQAEHCLTVAALPWHHRDPFDRLLVAQATCERLTLLTVDRQLTAYGRHVRLA